MIWTRSRRGLWALTALLLSACGGLTADEDPTAKGGASSGGQAGGATAGAGGHPAGQGGGSTAGQAGAATGGGNPGGSTTGGSNPGGKNQGGGATAGSGGTTATCAQTVVDVGFCEGEGLTCADACGHTCQCSGGTWHCDGPCGSLCAPASSCQEGETCETTLGACVLACHCTDSGVFFCEKKCPPGDCAAGASCQPGAQCALPPDASGCPSHCFCDSGNTYSCVPDCPPPPVCPDETSACGQPCASAGVTCTCQSDDGPQPCVCPGGPSGTNAWICPDSGACQEGAKCVPPTACVTDFGPDGGCPTACECGFDGQLHCQQSCPPQCPASPPPCAGACEGAEGASGCQCIFGNDMTPCHCVSEGPNFASWHCDNPPPIICEQGAKCSDTSCSTYTPQGCLLTCDCVSGAYDCKISCTSACKPGVFCPAGNTCSVTEAETGCTRDCSCSLGNLWQCAASCDGSTVCPVTPQPGTTCETSTLCEYDGLRCICSQGAWSCTDS